MAIAPSEEHRVTRRPDRRGLPTESGVQVSVIGERVSRRLDWGFVVSALGRTLLPLWFLAASTVTLINFAGEGLLAIDARLYHFAAAQVLNGGNPWLAHADGTAFAGPPPTLLFYLPTALLPESVATAAMVLLGFGAAVWAVRRLGLPWWWLLFPPLFEAVIVGNPDALVLALLLVRGPAAGLAAGLKVYAVVPLLLERRWSAVAVAAIVSLFSLPLAPQFIASLGSVSAVLDQQTAHLSAWGTWLVVPTIVALAVLRRHGAAWLVVPALWPNTQRHYAAMSLPAVCRSPIGAAVMSLNVPLAPPVAVMVMAAEQLWRSRSGSSGTVPTQRQTLLDGGLAGEP